MELNPEIDLEVDVNDLTSEFKRVSLLLYRYYNHKAKIEAKRDTAKAVLKEAKALAYKKIKSDITVKHTEKSMESEVDLDTEVKKATRELIQAEHDASTWYGAVDSLKAKKDMLIQLGSDRRKEL